MAINKALDDVKNKETGEVPMHIRNAPVSGMEKLGYGKGYLYPHDFPGNYVEQQYLPDKMVGTKYYEPLRRVIVLCEEHTDQFYGTFV